MKNEIVCEDLRKTVGKKTVLDGLSIKAESGKITALLGPNGAGKTTGFSVLCGLIKPDSGKIFLNNKDITALPMYKRARLGIGYLPQESSIFRGLSVEENIMAILEMSKIKKQDRPDVLQKLLVELSLEHIRTSPAISISGGERRKLEIARALAISPNFILLDEPFAGIDPIAISDLVNVIFKLRNDGIGVVITDHNVRDTLPIADYGYILYNGKVFVEGKPDEIINNQKAQKIYLGESFSVYSIFHKPDR